jgi:hypothetical protein
MKSTIDENETFFVDEKMSNDIYKFINETLTPIFNKIPYNVSEQILMISVVLNSQPDIVLDWGTHLGVSSRIFYEIGKYFHLKYKVHTFDLKEENSHFERLNNDSVGQFIKECSSVTQHYGDGVEEALKILAKKKRFKKPLFFVDGDHKLETVSRELTSIFETIESPFVLVHDTWSKGENNGPWQACHSAKEKYDLVLFTIDQDAPGMTFLRRKKL